MIKGKYKVTDIIKQTDSKQVQRVFLVQNPKQTYILKSFSNDENNKKYINRQIQVYQKLKEPHLNGFLELKEAFQENSKVFFVFNQIGEDIDFLRKRCGGRLTLKTVLLIAIQALQRIQYIHSTGFLHGDIKPCNFIMGIGKYCHKLYLVDFELATPYKIKGKHIQPQIIDAFSGSIKYCSVNANSHKNISRKDQLQSLIYCLIFLLKGDLPWFNLKAQTLSEAYDETQKLKKSKRDDLLQGLPDFFGKMLKQLQLIKFQEQPPYKAFRTGITELMKKNGYQIDYKYDWDFI